MFLVVLLFIGYVGSQLDALRWTTFAKLAAALVPALALRINLVSQERIAQGRGLDDIQGIPNLATSYLLSYGLWATALVIGYLIGRRRQNKDAP